MAKSIDIQRKLKEQLDLLDELGGININIDDLVRNLKSEVNKYISKNQRNIQNLLEVERGMQRLIGQQHASLGTLEDNLKGVFEIISGIGKFGKTIERINKHADKVNQTLASVNMDAIKDFDVNVVVDFFGAMNKNFSLNKMNRLSKYISSISLDGLQIVTDDLKKFDINIITTFLGTISRLFGENRLNKVVGKISKTSGTEDFQIVLMYLKDMDKFLSDSISYLNKMTNRIKNFVNKTLASVNMDAIKDFDVNVVVDFFGAMNKNFSLNKMNRLSKYISSISLDGLQIVTDDLKKFDINIITTFLGTISRLFGENRLNKVVGKISKTSGTEDFQIVLMYLKDMDKFLSDSISYLNKMTNRIKNFVNKTNVNAGGTPDKLGGGAGGGGDKGMFGRLMFAGAGIAFLAQQAPALTRVLGLVFMIGKGFIEAGSKIGRGFKMMFGQLPEGASRATMVMKGLVGVLGGLALAGGIVVGILIMGIRKLLQGIEEAQRMRLQAAQGAGLNELAFMGTGAAGQATPGGILARFAGAGEERMISARAQMLARMGGNERLGGMSNIQAKGMAVMSQLFGLTLDKTAQLRDIMENIMGMNFEEKSISFINKYGVLANKVVKDISENTREYVLYGSESFERLSSLANKLSINTRDAIKLVEKFSTVSGSIDTAFGVTLTTGKFMNPLTQFMRYAFGDPDKIFEDVINNVGDISKMNRIQQKYLSDTLGMSVDELVVATERFKKIQQVGEQQYNEQYKTLEQITQSYGFQRLLGGLSEILDMLEQEVLRGYFQRALDWIKSNGERLPKIIEDIASFIRDKVIPVIIDVFTTIAKGVIGFLGSPLVPSGISGSEADGIIRSIESFSNTVKGFGSGTRVDDAFISQGRIIKTNPRDTAIFAQTPEALLSNAIRAASSMGGIVSGDNIVGQNREDRIRVIEVKSDVKLDGYKVGEGLTTVALEYTQ